MEKISSIATEIVSKVVETVKRCQMQKIYCNLEICYRFAVKQKMIRAAWFFVVLNGQVCHGRKRHCRLSSRRHAS